MHLMTERQVAEALNCTVSALRRWRRDGRGPRFVHIGRLVRYIDNEVVAFIQAGRDKASTPKPEVVSDVE